MNIESPNRQVTMQSYKQMFRLQVYYLNKPMYMFSTHVSWWGICEMHNFRDIEIFTAVELPKSLQELLHTCEWRIYL